LANNTGFLLRFFFLAKAERLCNLGNLFKSFINTNYGVLKKLQNANEIPDTHKVELT
jgi:hypothetical protein